MKLRVCPICVLTSVTWISLLIARSLGYAVDLSLITLLMGGSVVGSAYVLAKRLPLERQTAWKFWSIILGFILVYTAISSWWLIGGVAGVLLLALYVWFFRSKKGSSTTQEIHDLEEKMKNCC